uniref:Uncharacterized protein n=1 Tax=Opuntia streptacantha TaxID=393608 RepID=A0A7C9EAK6_OPUST
MNSVLFHVFHLWLQFVHDISHYQPYQGPLPAVGGPGKITIIRLPSPLQVARIRSSIDLTIKGLIHVGAGTRLINWVRIISNPFPHIQIATPVPFHLFFFIHTSITKIHVLIVLNRHNLTIVSGTGHTYTTIFTHLSIEFFKKCHNSTVITLISVSQFQIC